MSVSPRWTPPKVTGCAPLIHHWHLRKCAGTAIRDAMRMHRMQHPHYVEFHDSFAALVHGERQQATVLRKRGASMPCGVRRIVVLREPYAQFASEVAFFPSDFLRGSGDASALTYVDDHFVCSSKTMMGLCKRRGACNVSRVMEVLQGFDFVGWTNSMDTIFSVLRGWLSCGGRPNAEVTGRLETLAKVERSSLRSLSRDVARGIPPNYTARLEQQLRDRNASVLTRRERLTFEALRRLPSRQTFEARNRCAMEVYRAALQTYGPRGGPLPPRGCA